MLSYVPRDVLDEVWDLIESVFECFPTDSELAVQLAIAGVVFKGVSLCCPFSHEMSWMRS